MKSAHSTFLALATADVLAVGASGSAQVEPKDKTLGIFGGGEMKRQDGPGIRD